MTIGIVRMVQLAGTLVVAGPVAMASLLNFLEGEYLYGGLLLAAAVGLVVVSEYVYVRLTDRTVGRVRRLRSVSLRDRAASGLGRLPRPGWGSREGEAPPDDGEPERETGAASDPETGDESSPEVEETRDSETGVEIEDAETGVEIEDAESGVEIEDAETGVEIEDAETGVEIEDAESGVEIEDVEADGRKRE